MQLFLEITFCKHGKTIAQRSARKSNRPFQALEISLPALETSSQALQIKFQVRALNLKMQENLRVVENSAPWISIMS